MKDKKGEILLDIFVILSLFFGIFVLLISMDNIHYILLSEEGYVVRHTYTSGCEILLRNIDNSTFWVSCWGYKGRFILENWGVKK